MSKTNSTAQSIQNDEDFKIELIQNSMLFKNADAEAMHHLAKNIKKSFYKTGDPIFIENELSNCIYFINTGSVEIVNYNSKLKHGNRIKILKEKEIFSEFSVLAKTNHSTSCFAIEDSEIYILNESEFISVLKKFPDLCISVVQTLARLSQQLNSKDNYIEYFKPELININKEIISLIPFSLIKKHSMIPLKKQGNTLSIALKNPLSSDFYNEILIKNANIQLKIYSVNDVDFEKHQKQISNYYTGYLNIPELKYDNLPETTQSQSIEIESVLKSTTIFSSLPDELIKSLLPYFQTLALKSDSILFEPQSASNAFYIIESGAIEILRSLPNGTLTPITMLSKNDTLGEISLLTNSLNTTFAKTTKDTVVHILEKSTFEGLLGNTDFCLSIARALAQKIQNVNKQQRVQRFSDMSKFDESATQLLPKEIIIKHKIIPLIHEQNSITIGIVNSDETIASKVINYYLSKFRITINSISNEQFQELCTKSKISLYSSQDKNLTLVKKTDDAIKYVENMIISSFSQRASDIHIEPEENAYSIRLRIDGELIDFEKHIDRNLALQVLNRIKVLCKIDISDSRFPQDGQLLIEKQGQKYMARISSVPSKLGEKFVLRLIHEKTSLVPMNRLAVDKDTVKFLKNIIKNKQGLFLITGPTGSGKTTTLYSILNEVNEISTNIISVENPVELVIPGITQIEVNDSIDLSYNRILRHVLRQDPDTIMVGEVRDSESAKIVFQSAMTGHLVFSTIHTTNSIDTVPRLIELGVSLQTIGSALLGVMAQRLIPALCTSCKYKRKPTKIEADILAAHVAPDKMPTEVTDSKGCLECNGRKYKGRVPVFEYWKNTSTVKNVILSGGTHNDLLSAIKLQNFRSLYKFAIQMMLNGITTIDQVERYLFGMDFDEFTGF